jgi:hypothetical protein
MECGINIMEWNSKEILLKELEDEYMKQFPNSERPSNSLFDIGIDGIIEGLQNRNGKKIRIVYSRGRGFCVDLLMRNCAQIMKKI